MRMGVSTMDFREFMLALSHGSDEVEEPIEPCIEHGAKHFEKRKEQVKEERRRKKFEKEREREREEERVRVSVLAAFAERTRNKQTNEELTKKKKRFVVPF